MSNNYISYGIIGGVVLALGLTAYYFLNNKNPAAQTTSLTTTVITTSTTTAQIFTASQIPYLTSSSFEDPNQLAIWTNYQTWWNTLVSTLNNQTQQDIMNNSTYNNALISTSNNAIAQALNGTITLTQAEQNIISKLNIIENNLGLSLTPQV